MLHRFVSPAWARAGLSSRMSCWRPQGTLMIHGRRSVAQGSLALAGGRLTRAEAKSPSCTPRRGAIQGAPRARPEASEAPPPGSSSKKKHN
jgi:hypothetical protein